MADMELLNENMDITKLKVPDLKRELKVRGLSTSGNKGDLMERLQNSFKSKLDDAIESVDDLDDDLLNDDDLDHDQLDASESVLTALDEQLDVSPPTKVPKRKISNDIHDFESKPLKKIVLNRNPSLVESSNLGSQNENGSLSKAVDGDIHESKEKKTIKLSELSSKERLEMRAKKFGSPTTDAAKKVARAERFSLTTDSSASATNTSITTEATPALDALKKRAERFGGSVSKVMSSVELQERIEKRKARFGSVTTTNGASQDEKALKRLERFKTAVK